MKINVIRMAAVLLAAVMSGGVAMSAKALIPGVSPNIDPTLITDTRLPDAYDQDFPGGMPFGYAVVGEKVQYAFGVGVDSEGNIYSASFETQTVVVTKKDADGRISLYSPVERIKLHAPGLFGMTIDKNDNIIFGGQLSPDGYVARYDRKTGKTTKLITDLVRPNQMAVDNENNIYVVTEDGSIYRYNDKDGTVDQLAKGVASFQSCCVDADGNVYLLSFGRFSDVPIVGVGYEGGSLRVLRPDGTIEVVWQGNDQYVWRARGLAIDDKGYVYMTGEGNVWDNGNSANIVRFDPGTRTVEPVTSGMDFSTFIAFGSDGRFYQNLARDNLVVAYSAQAARETVENDWSKEGIRVISYGGTYLPSDKANLTFKIGSLTVSGAVTSAKNGRVSGWIRVPCEKVPEIDSAWNPSNEGDYPLPSVTVTGDGTCKTAVMPHRVHIRSRWPLPNVYTPAADYRENPGAYLVYFEWIPDHAADDADPAEYYDKELKPAGPAYSVSSLATMDFSASPGYAGRPEGDRLSMLLKPEQGEIACVTNANTIRFGLCMAEAKAEDALRLTLGCSGDPAYGFGLSWETTGKLTVTLWDGAATETVYEGYIPYNVFDGAWHTLSFTNDFGSYSLKLNGISVPLGDGFAAKAEALIGKTVTTLRLTTASGGGSILLRTEAEKTAVPITVDRTPAAEAPNKPSAGKVDPAAIVCMVAAVMAAAAAVTVVLTRQNGVGKSDSEK